LKIQKPIIGISNNVKLDDSGRFDDFWLSYVTEDYILSVLKAGGIPLLIPVVDDEDVIRAQLECIDAIIMTGGDADVNPALYAEKKTKSTAPNDRRDWFDLKLAKITQELKIPTLNICRACQLYNVYLGGSLYQDISEANKNHEVHDWLPKPDSLAHKINIEKDSILYEILQKDTIEVNSFHHQSVKVVANSLKVTAVSSDGIIESIEYKDPKYFFLSVQWHPEMLVSRGDEDMLKIFKRLIKEAKDKRV